MPERRLHVVFMPGPLGRMVAARLAAAGRHVRLVRRDGAEPALPGVEAVTADLRDGSEIRAAVHGAEAVYHCVSGACAGREWDELLPRLHAHLVDAAGRAGARLVVLDDLSAYGSLGGRPISEDTPPAPRTRSGALRARLFEDLAAAACRGDVRAVVGRASDLFGPAVWGDSVLGERFWRDVVAGQPGPFPGNPDTVHTWHYAADVAAALVVLGRDPASDGLWMLPCAPAHPTRALVGRMAAALGHVVPLRRDPRLGAGALGLALHHAREEAEAAHRFEEPWLVDDGRFRERYGDLATPLDRAARQTVDDALARLLAPGAAAGAREAAAAT